MTSIHDGGRRIGDPVGPDIPEEIAQRYARENVLRELDRELNLETPEVGRDLMLAAEVDLKERGILLEDATQKQLAAALEKASR